MFIHHKVDSGEMSRITLFKDAVKVTQSIASVIRLAPVHFPRRVTRPVSYYALFKWWLLLSQHPGCLGNSTSFPT